MRRKLLHRFQELLLIVLDQLYHLQDQPVMEIAHGNGKDEVVHRGMM